MSSTAAILLPFALGAVHSAIQFILTPAIVARKKATW